jgi:hypothetical protein
MSGGNIRFKEMPKMNAAPYIKRAPQVIEGPHGVVAVSFVLSLIMCLLPFVAPPLWDRFSNYSGRRPRAVIGARFEHDFVVL